MLTEREYDQVVDAIQTLEDINELPEILGYLCLLRDLHKRPMMTWRERFFALRHGYLRKRED